MVNKLATYVHVDGAVYGPDDDVPSEVAEKITNPDAWQSQESSPTAAHSTHSSTEQQTEGRSRRSR